MAGGTGGCRPDNLRCHQWRRGWCRGGSQNSVAYWLINVRLWLDKQGKLVTGRYRENIVDAGFVMAGGTGGCRPDNYGAINGGVAGVVATLSFHCSYHW